MGDLEQSRALAEQVAAHFGRIDVVVGSAAKGGPNHTIMNADLGDWQEAWQVNVLGPLELARAAIPHLRAVGGGAIVMVSTLAVRAINIGQGAYAATKSALTVAAQTLAKEVGPDGIRVNIVVPGFVPGPNTDTMFARLAERRGTTPQVVMDEMAAETALNRHPTPDDVADAIVFLASDRARSITGSDARRQRGTMDGLKSTWPGFGFIACLPPPRRSARCKSRNRSGSARRSARSPLAHTCASRGRPSGWPLATP